ncbi:uncharacterized protein [Miscanthus floridulus]|uniref:uncharacterized protein n=1 Tax=Miscanthus floridulus TaxID=154761 RepID=UPI00345933F6
MLHALKLAAHSFCSHWFFKLLRFKGYTIMYDYEESEAIIISWFSLHFVLLSTFASPPPSLSVKAATSRRATSPSPSAGKTLTAPRARAVRGTRTPTPTRATSSSSVKPAAWLARSPTRFAGKSAPRLVRGIRTPGATSSSVKAAAASRASRSAVKTATPAVRGTPRTVTSKHLEAKLRRLRDGMISSEIRKKELTEGRDATATIAASVLQEASIFDSLLRNESRN